jgi:hypothetical protein
MAEATRTLRVTAPTKPLAMDLQTSGEGARELSPDQVEQIRKNRQIAAEHFRANETDGEEAEAPLPTDPVEDIESVEVQLPNGRIVEYGPRGNVSTRLRVAQIMGQSNNHVLFMTLNTLLNIRAIDGKAVRTITNQTDAQAIANAIGDSGLEVLERVHLQCWPGETRDSLPIVKKNLLRPGI